MKFDPDDHNPEMKFDPDLHPHPRTYGAPMKTVTKTVTKRVDTHEIKVSDFLEFLEVKGDPKVSLFRAFVRIPGGGDYSNQSLDIEELEGGCVYIELTYKTESS